LYYTESGLKLPGLDLASLATQGVCAGAKPNAYTGYGIYRKRREKSTKNHFKPFRGHCCWQKNV